MSHDHESDDVKVRTRGSGRRGSHRPGPIRVIATAALALVCATLPMFLVGSLAPRIARELVIDEVAIGTLVSVYFLSGAIWSLPGGIVTDRIGSTAALRASAAIASAVALAVALGGRSWTILIVLFVLGGAAVPLADTGGARAISTGVPLDRQGLAFGGKEASIPIASLLAGLAVPVLGVHLGWRPAYLVAASLAALAIALIPGGLDRPGPGRPTASEATPASRPEVAHRRHPAAPAGTWPVLVMLAISAALAGAAGNSAPTFLVSSAVAADMAEASAGLLLAVASTAGVAARLISGVIADRGGITERRLMSLLMTVGAIGMASLAVGGPAATLVGAMLTFGGGWGWTGLAFLAAVRLLPARPARAAGVILAGLGTGGALGPIVFGAFASTLGYRASWTAAALGTACAAALCLVADLRSPRDAQPRVSSAG